MFRRCLWDVPVFTLLALIGASLIPSLSPLQLVSAHGISPSGNGEETHPTTPPTFAVNSAEASVVSADPKATPSSNPREPTSEYKIYSGIRVETKPAQAKKYPSRIIFPSEKSPKNPLNVSPAFRPPSPQFSSIMRSMLPWTPAVQIPPGQWVPIPRSSAVLPPPTVAPWFSSGAPAVNTTGPDGQPINPSPPSESGWVAGRRFVPGPPGTRRWIPTNDSTPGPPGPPSWIQRGAKGFTVVPEKNHTKRSIPTASSDPGKKAKSGRRGARSRPVGTFVQSSGGGMSFGPPQRRPRRQSGPTQRRQARTPETPYQYPSTGWNSGPSAAPSTDSELPDPPQPDAAPSSQYPGATSSGTPQYLPGTPGQRLPEPPTPHDHAHSHGSHSHHGHHHHHPSGPRSSSGQARESPASHSHSRPSHSHSHPSHSHSHSTQPGGHDHRDQPRPGEVELVNVTSSSSDGGHFHGHGPPEPMPSDQVELIDVEKLYGEEGTGCRCVVPAACPAGGRRADRCGDQYICCPNDQLYQAKCGRLVQYPSRGLGPRGDTLGQQPDKIMAAPWAVALLLRLPVGYVFICGGALIHPQAVLTAARCVANLGEMSPMLVARLGDGISFDNSTTDGGPPLPFQEIAVAEVVTHPDYQWMDRQNDVAVLFLNSSAVLRPGLDTICLRPEPAAGPSSAAAAPQRCVLASYSLQEIAPIHPILHLHTMNQSESRPARLCQHVGHSSRLRALLCQQHPDLIDLTCPLVRDRAGSPVSCADPKSGEYRLTGVVAWGEGCALPLSHGLFTHVQPFFKWIDNMVTQNFRYFESYFGFNQV